MYKKAKENSVFMSNREVWHLNACVGTNGGPYNNRDYALGYFEAAKRLIGSLKSDSSRVDIIFYPLAYLYRHSAELYLKQIIASCECLSNEKGSKAFGHTLTDFFKRARDLCSSCSALDEIDWGPLEKFTVEIEDIDPGGETFRYAEKKSGAKSIEGSGLYNVALLHDSKVLYLEELDDICGYISHLIQEESEAYM